LKTARYPTVVRDFEHAERVTEKKRRIEVLRALLEMHQQQHEPDDEYIKMFAPTVEGGPETT
jgi:hypothetical protein